MFDICKTIGVWGDSVLKGVIFDEIRGTYQLLANSCGNLISKTLGLQIVNRSRFGSTVDKGRQTLEQSLQQGLSCDYVLLEYGGNDCDFDWPAVAADPELPHQPHTPLPRFRQQLQDMIDMLLKNKITPLLMSLPPINAEKYLDFLVSKGLNRLNLMSFLGDCQQIYRFHESYSLAVTNLALGNRCLYVPVRESFLAVRNSPDLLCIDGIHPNEKGHRLMQQVFTEMALA
jgi:acyl-CoA thioesterase-1